MCGGVSTRGTFVPAPEHGTGIQNWRYIQPTWSEYTSGLGCDEAGLEGRVGCGDVGSLLCGSDTVQMEHIGKLGIGHNGDEAGCCGFDGSTGIMNTYLVCRRKPPAEGWASISTSELHY